MSFDLLRTPVGALLSVVTLILIAGLDAFAVSRRPAPAWWRPAGLAMIAVLSIVIVARFMRFV